MVLKSYREVADVEHVAGTTIELYFQLLHLVMLNSHQLMNGH